MPKKQPRELIISQVANAEHREMLERAKEQWRPSRAQYAAWGSWINWKMEPDPSGWWYGWCPVSDREHLSSFSATFNFHYGSMRCNHDPVCHKDKRGITFANISQMMSLPRDAEVH